MRSIFYCVILTFVYPGIISAQSYIEYKKSGVNTWGNHYVPPVWTKTYKFDKPVYQSPPRSTSSSSSYRTQSGGYNSITSYVPKHQYSVSRSTSDAIEFIDMKIAVVDAKLAYLDGLDSAIKLFNTGFYKESKMMLDDLYKKPIAIIEKRSAEQYRKQASDSLYYWAFNFNPVKYCYQYFCNVKLQKYEDAIDLYNSFLSAHMKSGSTMKTEEVWPLTSEYYFVFGSEEVLDNFHFKNIVIHDRFRADLFFVEALIGLNKNKEAALYMDKTMEFYADRFTDLYPYLPQMAINYFFLNRIEEAWKSLEHYCFHFKSNAARFAIINDILQNERLSKSWNEISSPACFRFIEDNIIFIDSIQQAIDRSSKPYSSAAWKMLYLDQSNKPGEFIQRIAPEIEKDLDQRVSEIHTIKGTMQDNGIKKRVEEMNMYMIALLRMQDKERINRVLSILGNIAEDTKKRLLQRLPELQAQNLSSCKYWGWTGQRYWLQYYKNQATPSIEAANVFARLSEFSKAGGLVYMLPFLKPYLDDLSNYTEDEGTICITCWDEIGIKPNFRKSRSYPKKY